jgi:hypothetical protein
MLEEPIRVIAGLDPAIPITWHRRAFLSGMAGSSPAMTIQCSKAVTALMPPPSRRLDALERADVLRPLRREVRVIAGIEPHRDAAEILVGIELPFAGLHLDR